MYQCKVVLDSVSLAGARLTTFELSYPLIIHNEFMTHRAISRNAAANRAIPVERMLAVVRDDPYVPRSWWAKGAGMSPSIKMSELEAEVAERLWRIAGETATQYAASLDKHGLHKQQANRLLIPFQWITVIASATNWANFFHLRTAPDADDAFRPIAVMMAEAFFSSTPEMRTLHLPYITPDDRMAVNKQFTDASAYSRYNVLKKIATARCARVSYVNHLQVKSIDEDVALHDRLAQSGHWSPFEHVAKAARYANEPSGNFYGWHQYRKEFSGENQAMFTPEDLARNLEKKPI